MDFALETKRMLRVEEIELGRLHPWEENPRLNDHAVDAVAESIRSFGFNVPILCDQNLTIVAGHTRWKAAKKLGMEKVPAAVVEMTDAQRRAFSVADNKTAEIADWDFPRLREVLERLRDDAIDIGSLGFGDEEIRRLLLDDGIDEDLVPEVSDAPTTQVGDLYVLGDHRLLCGDSRDRASVLRLTEARPMDHVFGGPPYFNQREYAHWDEYRSYVIDMRRVIVNCRSALKDGGVCVWNIGSGSTTHHDHVSHHSGLFEEARFTYLDTIIWKKAAASYTVLRNLHVQSSGHYYPAFAWEALLVYQKPGKMPKMTREGRDYMSDHHTDVWEIAAVTNQVERYGHPAVCPVEIPFRSMQAYTTNGDSVLEPFGGSGTTLIAAEKAARIAYVIERKPTYCDVILKRWETLTGGKAVRAA